MPIRKYNFPHTAKTYGTTATDYPHYLYIHIIYTALT